ncbi:S-layer homology domain-containing protein [Paenibacillus aquistagni]|uniref:S-layer homology domain-containing protein n=1 Tax=Paenibacillus aquistagni TaxID=1852522 RepID=A0A1X7JE76_9BACL|nr:S-layer homology domain-containing protein [Paenibacillus aquistagni]SMG25962.1 S-layer homology domain-containing protein [Paenibacillus aquistagni]
MKPNMKKKVSTVTSALLAMTMTVSAVPAVLAAPAEHAEVTASAAEGTYSPVFSDVKLGHWAEKHIHKLAALGILKGNNGKFRPADDITQQEAIALAIRYMGLENELNESGNAALPEDFKVGNYFKSYTVLAFQKGLLNSEEELKNLDPKKPWGDQKASREWITKILVRAVGKESDAKQVMTMPTSFADNSKINASNLGYVNVAVELGLTTGVDKNRFDPQGKVTRAQIATFFSRGDAVSSIAYDAQVMGIVSEITDNAIKVYTEDGKWTSYRIDDKTMWYKSDSEKSILKSDIPMYTKVKVISTLNSAPYVELMDAKQQVETITGKVKYVLPGENTIFVNFNSGEDTRIKYEDNTSFKDASGNVIAAKDLKVDSEIEIMKETFSQERKVLVVKVKSGPVNKTATGTIASIDTTARNLEIQAENGAKETFRVADDVIVRYGDQIMPNGIKDLSVNSKVSYTVKNSVITSIELAKAPEVTIQGRLFEVGPTKTSVTILKDDGKLEAKRLVTRVSVVIKGMTNPSIDDLVAGEYGDRVKLTVNGDDQVTQIEVVDRKVESLIGASVINYDKEKKLLSVTDDKNKPYIFYLGNDTKYEYNGNPIMGEAILSMLNGSRKINIQYTADKVLLVQIVHKYEGTLIHASTSSRTITLKLANDQIVTLPYQYSLISVDMFGKSNATLTDVNSGDYVTALLSTDQNYVISLAVRSYKQFEVAQVNTSSNRVSLRDTDNIVKEIYVGSQPIYNEKNERINLSSLTTNDVVNAIFDGSNLVELRVIPVTTGIVESVDTSNGVVVIKNYAGQTSTYSSANGLTVLASTGAASSISSLKVGDRVEARKDAKNASVLKVQAGLSKTFWKYDASSRELSVRRSNLNDNNYRYTISPNAYIHSNGNTISVSSLKDGDSLVLYLQKGQIVEIEKL